MASLKDLRQRISSIKSTRKITSAMKMVAASRLRRAQSSAEQARPYARRMERMLGSLAQALAGHAGAPRMLAGTGSDQTHLLIVFTSDRGLCGGFNGTIVRGTRQKIAELKSQGKDVKLLIIGRRGREQLRRDFGSLIIGTFDGIGRKVVEFHEAQMVAEKVLSLFEEGAFDVTTAIYNSFRSAISHELTFQQLIPFPAPAEEASQAAGQGARAVYEFEPAEDTILQDLLPRNLIVQIFKALLESNASEQGARMTAMDNATRNAGDMIKGLSIKYNRARQAYITKELIEIISGAEAV